MMHKFSGVATAETVDLDGDVIVAAGVAWPYWARMKTLYTDHEYTVNTAIGRMTGIRLDAQNKRVLVDFEVDDSTELGRDTVAKIKARIVNGLSIGFRALDSAPPSREESKKWPGVRQVIHRCELLECSVTAMPCNDRAMIFPTTKKTIVIPSATGSVLPWRKPVAKRTIVLV